MCWWVTSTSKVNLPPEGMCKQRTELVKPRSCGEGGGLSVSAQRSDWDRKGTDSPVQAIFAALGLCCLGGKGAGSGCWWWWWQLLRSFAAGFLWLPNPKPVELSVRTDRGKPCCEESSLEGSRTIPQCFWFLLVCFFLFSPFFFLFRPF